MSATKFDKRGARKGDVQKYKKSPKDGEWVKTGLDMDLSSGKTFIPWNSTVQQSSILRLDNSIKFDVIDMNFTGTIWNVTIAYSGLAIPNKLTVEVAPYNNGSFADAISSQSYDTNQAAGEVTFMFVQMPNEYDTGVDDDRLALTAELDDGTGSPIALASGSSFELLRI